MEFSHTPVLAAETIDLLHIRPDGFYVDGTCGGGGHSGLIAAKLKNGLLLGIDQDPDAIKAAGEHLAPFGDRVKLVQSNFVRLPQILKELDLPAPDGILLDLGVSSHQLDEGARGFSYHTDAPLDMRMSQTGETAAELLERLEEREIAEILREYSEEKFASRIAKFIVREREISPIDTTGRLAEIVMQAIPTKAARTEKKHPARRTFQALRIAVNNELGVLKETLESGFEALSPGGRMAVITFHSLEDRITKQHFAAFCTGCTCPPDFPVCVCGKEPRGRLINKKPVTACETELSENSRSRTAKLRVIEKL